MNSRTLNAKRETRSVERPNPHPTPIPIQNSCGERISWYNQPLAQAVSLSAAPIRLRIEDLDYVDLSFRCEVIGHNHDDSLQRTFVRAT